MELLAYDDDIALSFIRTAQEINRFANKYIPLEKKHVSVKLNF